MGLVTLLTDFGLADTYVGQLKAAILAVAAGVTLVDLTHAVPPQDVQAGAFLLWSAVEACAPGTLHVAVVDPGVGSARRAVAIRAARGDVFFGPDNGLLLPALERLGGPSAAVALTEPAYWSRSVSRTFHGRDVFGPVAGHVASGVPLERLGPRIDNLVRAVALPQPHGLAGEVVHVDTYGNLVTNLPALTLEAHVAVHVAGQRVPVAAAYAAVEPGALLALVGSAGLVEIAARDGSAAAIIGAGRGTPVRVEG